MKIEQFIKELRNSDGYIEHIYTRGSCYRFHILLSKMYKGCVPYISDMKNHIITKYRGKYYDINGESTAIGYTILSDDLIPFVENWSFHKNNLIVLDECPHCEESLTYKETQYHYIPSV